MNLALGFIVLFLIALPGIVFRVTYLSSPYSRRKINTTAIDEIFSSLIPAFAVHSVCLLLLIYCGHRKIQFNFLFTLLTGNNSRSLDIDAINNFLPGFVTYLVVNVIINFFIAWIARLIVIKYRLDKLFPILRIYNHWYNILKPNAQVSVWLDLLVSTQDGDMLYRGFLDEFYLDQGNIEELHLTRVRRRKLSLEGVYAAAESGQDFSERESSTFDSRYYFIEGEQFVIKYAEVKNINITYYSLEPDPEKSI